ncbi:copper ion binding protein [Paenibacillus hodogayensis]|uniref:Copper ion binding protein n=1 Tax=Paenibacillus hodogayensis TaxID=279208 RepID=A0ABV5W367_9BACL
MQNVNLQVKGMSCGHCVNSIESTLKNLGATAKVDLASHSVAVQYDDAKLTLGAIKDAIEDQGYDVV